MVNLRQETIDTYNLYNPEIISELAGDEFILKKYWYETIGHTKWFEVALQKI
jgi:hypothetical protein